MEFGAAPPLWAGGPAPGAFYSPNSQPAPYPCQAPCDPVKHTTRPTVTGTSILAMKFKGGVVLAGDTLGSYGSMARFRNMSRFVSVGENTVVGASGDIADFHHIKDLLEDLMTEYHEADDGHKLSPKAVHTYLTRILYNRRTKGNPLWNTLVVAGFEAGESYLGVVDKIGVAYPTNTASSGYGAHIALPILRVAHEENPDMTQEEATAEIEKCMKVLFYRDARTINKYQVSTVTTAGVDISEPRSPDTNWNIASMVCGYE